VLGQQSVEQLEFVGLVHAAEAAEADHAVDLAQVQRPQAEAALGLVPERARYLVGRALAADHPVVPQEAAHARIGPQRVDRVDVPSAERTQAQARSPKLGEQHQRSPGSSE